MTTVYFATNRSLVRRGGRSEFGTAFNVDGPAALRFGRAEVTGDAYDQFDVHVAPEKLSGRSTRLGSAAIFQELTERLRNGEPTNVLLFIHGYACTFEDALARTAEITDKYGDGKMIAFAFSWPANGRMVPLMSYYSDRNDAKASGEAMARAALKLKAFIQEIDAGERCERSIHLVAHSMGNYALRHAVQGIRSELGDRNLPRLFDNIFLMAADEDDDAFEHDHKLRLLSALGRMVHVYFNPGDRALIVSDVTKANPDRLGSDGPRLADLLPRKVVLVNCQDVDYEGEDFQVHQYYRRSPEVIEDVRQALAGTPPQEMTGRRFEPATRSYRIEKNPAFDAPI